MTIQQTILDEIDPELAGQFVSRRNLFRRAAVSLGSVATAPTLLAACATSMGAGLPAQIIDALNFALTLEYLEDEFYRIGLSEGVVPRRYQAVFVQISEHESAHVALLRSVLGNSAVPKPTFDFTAGGAFGDVFTNPQTFMALSQAFEDTGVRAYKGQAGNLMSDDGILTTALQIHSVEARHASEVRRIRGQKGWITGSSRGNLPAATQPIYQGEGQTTQLGIPIRGVPSSAASEAFDEPLSKDQVLQIASLFIVSA